MGKKKVSNMSKNEPKDKTVDIKLTKWREKSIAMAEQRKHEEEERKNNNVIKLFLRNNPAAVAAGAIILAAVAVFIIVFAVRSGKINPEKYITIRYSGAEGYAAAECVVDSEKLYEKLAEKEKDSDKLSRYRKFADSVYAEVDKEDIANGDKLSVNVYYDEQAAKEAGAVLLKNRYNIKAQGIEKGTEIDLFSQVEVTFAGISPKAFVIVTNKWEEEYLSTLSFTVDRSENIAKGDTVTIQCEADKAELGRHGYLADETEIPVTADGLSVYAENKDQLEESVMSVIQKEVFDTIVSQTEDNTFRMLYRASGNDEFLRNDNVESAADLELMDIYFLKRRNGADAVKDNYVYYVCSANISNSETWETVYFVFEYSDGYVTSDGKYDIIHDNNDKRYDCSLNYESLIEEKIMNKEETYDIAVIK